ERTVSQIKAVTDAAAHDLRTPLTHARNRLYRLSRDGDLCSADGEQVSQAIEEIDAVVGRFSALMRISELEQARRTAGFARISLADIADAVAELYQPLAEDLSLAFRFEASDRAWVIGDEKLLFEAVSNLVDNAIKFSPVGGTIELTVVTQGNRHHLAVRDQGPGIAADHRSQVLRRFDRGAAPAESAGAGLGLSIVSAILHLHHFVLEMNAAAPGLHIEIIAPSAMEIAEPE
ncbi:MAG TPA: HAMP domain-containing sensor histidine kinase, partial [Novosphingobium sp.]